MKTTNSVKGLMTFAWYGLKNNLLVLLAFLVLAGVAVVIIGNGAVLPMYSFGALQAPIIIFLTSLGGKDGNKWEKFQIAMPIKRSDFPKSHYLFILFASLIGVPISVGVLFATHIVHPDLIAFSWLATFQSIAPYIPTAWFTVALLYPLSYTAFGHDKQDVLMMISLLIANVTVAILPNALYHIGLTATMSALAILGIGLIIYGISYMITKGLCQKKDI